MILLDFQSLEKYGIKMTIVHSNNGCVLELDSKYLHIQFLKKNQYMIHNFFDMLIYKGYN
jgi:hypothetical protein